VRQKLGLAPPGPELAQGAQVLGHEPSSASPSISAEASSGPWGRGERNTPAEGAANASKLISHRQMEQLEREVFQLRLRLISYQGRRPSVAEPLEPLQSQCAYSSLKPVYGA